MPRPNPKHRYCFTINNYNETDIELCKALRYDYLLLGFEVGDKGTPHIQGYVELRFKQRLKALSKLLPRAHIESCKGTQAHNIHYCKKGGDFVEFGTPRKQGSRTDLDRSRYMASTDGMRSVVQSCSLQEIQVAEKFLTYCEPKRNHYTTVVWIWGPSGIGKSSYIREAVRDKDVYWKSADNKWWQGYDGHKVVVMDDFRASWCTFNKLLEILDNYPCTVENKGGSRQLLAERIYVSSIHPPELIYPDMVLQLEPIAQLTRRIDLSVNLREKDQIIEDIPWPEDQDTSAPAPLDAQQAGREPAVRSLSSGEAEIIDITGEDTSMEVVPVVVPEVPKVIVPLRLA
jgi:hypothetical protein